MLGLISEGCDYDTCRNPDRYNPAESSGVEIYDDIIDTDWLDFYDTSSYLVETQMGGNMVQDTIILPKYDDDHEDTSIT